MSAKTRRTTETGDESEKKRKGEKNYRKVRVKKTGNGVDLKIDNLEIERKTEMSIFYFDKKRVGGESALGWSRGTDRC